MKYVLICLFALTLFGESIAQTMYESPHVKEGKTIQFTIPEGYWEAMDMGPGNTIFASQKDLNPSETDFANLDIGVIMVMHIPKDGESLQTIKEEMEKKSDFSKDGVTVISAPKVVNVNGKECLYAGYDGDFIEEGASKAYFAVMEFGDYFVMVNYISSKTFKDHLVFEKFQGIFADSDIVATDKEDEIEGYYHEDFADDELEDYSIYFTNDLFETEISYYDILPDIGPEWEDYIDQSGHLLSMFSYKNDGGFVKIFSGGLSSKYPSEEEKADAIERAMNWGQPMTLTLSSQFSNEDHFFKLYTISGGGTMTSVYTTIVNRELVFFVVDGGDNPDEGFKPAVRDFMLTMWVDYFEEEDE